MKIITDSGSLYSPEEGKKIGIEVLPLHVIADKKSYKEFVDIPTSSQPPIGETLELFEKYADEEVLVINMADGLSGTYQSTMAAKQSMEHNENIHVINSMTLCGPQKYLVDKAIQLKEKGLAIENIMKEIHKSIASEQSFLIPQDFDFLKRGGRLTPLAATIGGMLKIIPVMTKTKDGKRLEKFTMKKTLKGAIKEIIKYFQTMEVNENYRIYVSHAGVLEQAEAVIEQIQKCFEKVKIELLELSPAFIAQGGPGCIAIQAIRM